jgi:hypothetical protein
MKRLHFFLAVAATLLAAIALLSLFMIRYKKSEGFANEAVDPVMTSVDLSGSNMPTLAGSNYNPTDGEVPAAAQTSSIPADVGGATSSNPQVALAAPKDVEATSDALQTFKLLLAQKDPTTTDLSSDLVARIQQYQAHVPAFENQLKSAYSNPELTGMTLETITMLRESLVSLTKSLSSAMVIRGAASTVPAQNMGGDNVAYIDSMPQPTLVATPPSQIGLQDLISLRDRINKESLKLANLRSRAPTMMAKQNQLESLAGDLTDMITRIQAGTLSITDVPITKDDAENFMTALDTNRSGPLPNLQLPSGVQKSTAQQPVKNTVEDQLPGLQNPQLQQLLKNAQYLKWGLQMNVSYDPELAAQDRVIQRLEAIENRLTQLATSETPLPDSLSEAFMKELGILQQLVQTRSKTGKASQDRFPTKYTKASDETTIDVSTPDVPSEDNLATAQGKGMGPTRGSFPNGELSPDVYVRPGFIMNDESIKHRGSGGSFDPAAVGGPDWQKRSLDLCKQIQSANLGDTKNFGCIANPNEVGPSYSWKGNYNMVCNRLGDTWGGWYPAMFGCPTYDPTAKFKGTMA